VVVADDTDQSVHHEVLAHPCFLALSPFFRAILQSGMKEAQEKRIELTEVTRECFLLVLEFLHTGMECARSTHPRTRARARTSRLTHARTHA
jgi:nitrate reductase assembly molybdenum cofactor insertion protein NarJ